MVFLISAAMSLTTHSQGRIVGLSAGPSCCALLAKAWHSDGDAEMNEGRDLLATPTRGPRPSAAVGLSGRLQDQAVVDILVVDVLRRRPGEHALSDRVLAWTVRHAGDEARF